MADSEVLGKAVIRLERLTDTLDQMLRRYDPAEIVRLEAGQVAKMVDMLKDVKRTIDEFEKKETEDISNGIT